MAGIRRTQYLLVPLTLSPVLTSADVLALGSFSDGCEDSALDVPTSLQFTLETHGTSPLDRLNGTQGREMKMSSISSIIRFFYYKYIADTKICLSDESLMNNKYRLQNFVFTFCASSKRLFLKLSFSILRWRIQGHGEICPEKPQVQICSLMSGLGGGGVMN